MARKKTIAHKELKTVNANTAAIDIGSTMYIAAVNPEYASAPSRADQRGQCQDCGQVVPALQGPWFGGIAGSLVTSRNTAQPDTGCDLRTHRRLSPPAPDRGTYSGQNRRLARHRQPRAAPGRPVATARSGAFRSDPALWARAPRARSFASTSTGWGGSSRWVTVSPAIRASESRAGRARSMSMSVSMMLQGFPSPGSTRKRKPPARSRICEQPSLGMRRWA